MATLAVKPPFEIQSRSATLPAPVATKQFVINPWIIALTVTLATFMKLLDISIPTWPFHTSEGAWAEVTTRSPGF